jgi:hypothetical protein
MIVNIEQFVAACNKIKAPFQWAATADPGLTKLQQPCSQICGTPHQEFAENPHHARNGASGMAQKPDSARAVMARSGSSRKPVFLQTPA